MAAAQSGPPRPKPQNLWRSYPLNPKHSGSGGGSATATTRSTHTPRGGSAPAGNTGGSGSLTWPLLFGIAVAMAGAGTVAVIALRDLRRVTPVAHSGGAALLRTPRLSFPRRKGESIMSNQRFKPWARRESDAGSVQPAKQDTSGDDEEQTPAEAPADSSIVQRVFAATGDADTAPDVPAEPAPADLSEVGAEVGTVLKAAQEAADRIRSAAREEAARIREEAKAEVAAAVEEAQRLAESDRADGERVRKEAAAYAQQMRADAEREAEQILEKAQQRLDQADGEVEKAAARGRECPRPPRSAGGRIGALSGAPREDARRLPGNELAAGRAAGSARPRGRRRVRGDGRQDARGSTSAGRSYLAPRLSGRLPTACSARGSARR